MKRNRFFVYALATLLVLVSCAGVSREKKPPALPPPLPAAHAKTESAQEVPQPQPVTAQQQPEIAQQQAILRQQEAILGQQPVGPQSPPQSPEAGSIILEGAYTHIVRYQDTLSHIAERFYGRGNGYYYGLIMLASNITDPDTIKEGIRLVIPDLERNLADPGARARLKAHSAALAAIHAARGNSRDARNMRAMADAL